MAPEITAVLEAAPSAEAISDPRAEMIALDVATPALDPAMANSIRTVEANLYDLASVQNVAVRLSSTLEPVRKPMAAAALVVPTPPTSRDKKPRREFKSDGRSRGSDPPPGGKRRRRVPEDIWKVRDSKLDVSCKFCRGRYNGKLRDYWCEEHTKAVGEGSFGKNTEKQASIVEVFATESLRDLLPYCAMIDSGSTDHMTPTLDHIDPDTAVAERNTVKCAGNTLLQSET